MAIQEAKQQHPDMLVTKAVVIRESESTTDELPQKGEVTVRAVKQSENTWVYEFIHLKTFQIQSRGNLKQKCPML